MPAHDRIPSPVARLLGLVLVVASIAAGYVVATWDLNPAKLASPRLALAFAVFIAAIALLAMFLGLRLAFAPRAGRPRLPVWMLPIGGALFILMLAVLIWAFVTGLPLYNWFAMVTLAICGALAAFNSWQRARARMRTQSETRAETAS
jgi:hypothetical protein